MFLIFGLGSCSSPSLLPAIACSATAGTTSGTTGRLARNFALAITFTLLELFFDLLAQEDALVYTNWAIFFLFLTRIGVKLAGLCVSLLLLAGFEYFFELICEEVRHGFVLSASPFLITIATMLGRAGLPHQVKEVMIFVSNPHRM